MCSIFSFASHAVQKKIHWLIKYENKRPENGIPAEYSTRIKTRTNAYLKFCTTAFRFSFLMENRHLRNQHLCRQHANLPTRPPLFSCSIFLPMSSLSLFLSPSLSLSFTFYLGTHPGQIVALKISLKRC